MQKSSNIIEVVFLLSLFFSLRTNTFAQVYQPSKFVIIYENESEDEFPFPDNYSMEYYKELQKLIKQEINDIPVKDTLTGNLRKACAKGINDAKKSISKNGPKLLKYGSETIISINNSETKWYVRKVKQYIYSRKFGVELESRFRCITMQAQRVYVEAYNRLMRYALNSYYKIDIDRYVQEKVAEYILKYGEENPDWCVKEGN